MDQDYGKVALQEVATIKKFEGDDLVDTTHHDNFNPETYVIQPKKEMTKEQLEEIFKDTAPGYNLEYARAILIGLQRKHIYGGTVTDKVKGERRARNQRAKQSRRANRPR